MELSMYRPTDEGEKEKVNYCQFHPSIEVSESRVVSPCTYVTNWVPFQNCFFHNLFLVKISRHFGFIIAML